MYSPESSSCGARPCSEASVSSMSRVGQLPRSLPGSVGAWDRQTTTHGLKSTVSGSFGRETEGETRSPNDGYSIHSMSSTPCATILCEKVD